MEGLEKITSAILNDAKASCDKSYEDAKSEIEQIKKKYCDEAAKIIGEANAAAEKERESIISRGHSSAAMLRRNMLLSAKSKMVDEAYENAVGYISRMDKKDYLDMLRGMFSAAVNDTLVSEGALLCDEDSEYTAPDTFVVSLNEKDAEKYASELEKFASGVLGSTGKKYLLSPHHADIAGGMLIAYGDMFINCSLEQAVAEVREQTEPEVYKALFGNN